MELYDFFTHLINTMGISPRESFEVMLLMALGVYGGVAFTLNACLSFGWNLCRLVRRLLRAPLRTIRRRLKVHFQK